jgi:peptidoglycan hydrolase-like protein with peptidoglycan-binding domain
MRSLAALQSRLAALGFYAGPIDGIDTPAIRDAVVLYQRRTGLVADGLPGPVTQSHLFPEPPDPDLGRDADPPDAEPAGHPPIWPRQVEVERVFGAPGANQTPLIPPYPMRLAWETRTPITRFSIHERVHDSAMRCLTRIADSYDAAARADLGIDLFGGCLNVRPMRGGSRLSMHAWGIAIDFDPDRNALRWGHDRARLARPDAARFWAIWAAEGWVGLGRARDYDWMHVQAARL